MDAGWQGRSEGQNFFASFAKDSAPTHRFPTCMKKYIISAMFIALSGVDVIILSQFDLGFIEAMLTGSLMLISYGMGVFSGLAE
jgi:hypothetical protein